MRKNNPENVLAKRNYVAWLRNAGGRSEATVDMAAAALDRFDAFNKYKCFKAFRREQAISFKEHLAEQSNAATGKRLSVSTLHATLKAVRTFFEWLSREPGYRKLVYSDAAYFNVTDNEVRIATTRRERPAPSLDQVRHIVGEMPSVTVKDRRDRAVIALVMLTGARDGAAASLCLKHLDLASRRLCQDPREVKTKRAKIIDANFFPVGEPFETIVAEWVAELKRDHLFGQDDPLFPTTRMGVDAAGMFSPDGLKRRHWATAGPIRDIFRKACDGAGLPYYNPHSLRQTLTRLAYDLNLGHREMKAWSECLGHSSITTTVGSYGNLSGHERADVMARIGTTVPSSNDEEMAIARRLVALARQGGA